MKQKNQMVLFKKYLVAPVSNRKGTPEFLMKVVCMTAPSTLALGPLSSALPYVICSSCLKLMTQRRRHIRNCLSVLP